MNIAVENDGLGLPPGFEREEEIESLFSGLRARWNICGKASKVDTVSNTNYDTERSIADARQFVEETFQAYPSHFSDLKVEEAIKNLFAYDHFITSKISSLYTALFLSKLGEKVSPFGKVEMEIIIDGERQKKKFSTIFAMSQFGYPRQKDTEELTGHFHKQDPFYYLYMDDSKKSPLKERFFSMVDDLIFNHQSNSPVFQLPSNLRDELRRLDCIVLNSHRSPMAQVKIEPNDRGVLVIPWQIPEENDARILEQYFWPNIPRFFVHEGQHLVDMNRPNGIPSVLMPVTEVRAYLMEKALVGHLCSQGVRNSVDTNIKKYLKIMGGDFEGDHNINYYFDDLKMHLMDLPDDAYRNFMGTMS